MMKLQHVALCSSSEEKADKFYKNLLGLSKMTPKILSDSLSEAIFNIPAEFTIVNYQNDTLRFEIFIHRAYPINKTPVAHTCIEVPDRKAFLEKCREMNVMIREITKEDKIVTFISDYDGNLFEVV